MQGLGVADEDVPPGHKLAGQLLQNLLLRGPIEVNDHISAEDHVRLFGEAEVGVHEIQPPKLHQFAQFRNHAQHIGAADRGCA